MEGKTMEHPFIQFLLERDIVSESVARRFTENKRYVREPIGMIAVDHGLLDVSQIDEILDRQSETDKRFGEIAVEMGFMSEAQVERLVKIQANRVPADIAEILALAGVITCEDAVQYLGAFFLQDQEMESMVSEA